MRRLSGGWGLALAAAGAIGVLLSARSSTPPPFSVASLGPRAGAIFGASSSFQVRQSAQPDTVFRHADHEGVTCISCHSMDPAHGELRVRTLADCRSCHHAGAAAAQCATCHTQVDAPPEVLQVERAFELSVERARARTLPFAHTEHEAVSCATCHTEGLELSAARATCNGCHVEHHRPEARCATCHVALLDPPHEVDAHLGCGGSGCHTSMPFASMPRERAACVACHREQEEHRPERECVACHLLPPERPRPPGPDA